MSKFIIIYFPVALRPNAGHGLLILRFLDHTQRCITVGRTPLGEWSARRRDLYLTTNNTHNRQTSMQPVGIRTHDLSRREAACLRLRPRGHWDRHIMRAQNSFWGTRWPSWSRHWATSRKVAGSIPDGVIDIILPAALWPWGWLGL